jgi:hypothetical protein
MAQAAIVNGFQEVGFSLPVCTGNQVPSGGKFNFFFSVVTEVVELDFSDFHCDNFLFLVKVNFQLS